MDEEKTYTGEELSALLIEEGYVDMTLRNIRHYRQTVEGFPPLVLVKGKKKFTDEHLTYLRALKGMQKTGEKLKEIGVKLNSLTHDQVERVAEQSVYVSAERLLRTSTHTCSDDISITFSEQVKPSLKNKIIETVSQLIKGENKC